MATESPPCISFNERLRRARLAQDLTLRDLMKRCEQAGERINHVTLSRYEKGEFRPKRRRRRILAVALNIPFDDLDSLDENRQESA
ncbi:helix-turn-helix domain-containing protein [Sphaerisporangium sp. NBC_01403]|uniref:helix-turn-helix domain-containing protein n=1 Tax=Sphaerisporangium sp. NBC_01403 TaxID=2903599 RepID=UPI0032568521